MLVGAIDAVVAAQGAVVWCSPAGEKQPVDFDRSYVIEDGQLNPG